MGTINILCDTYEDVEIEIPQEIQSSIPGAYGINGEGGFGKTIIRNAKKIIQQVKTGTHIEQADGDKIKTEITDHVLSVIPDIDEKKFKGFELTEIEVTIGFEVKGGTAIPFIAKAGASVSSGVTFKIKKKGT